MPELRPLRSLARPSDSSGDHVPARVGVQSAPTKPSHVDGLDRGPTRCAGASPGWSAAVGNSPAGFRGARPGWSAVDGRPAGGGFPGRQQSPSGDACWSPREDRGIPAHRSSAGLGSRRVARLEPDQPEHALIDDRGDPAGLLPVEERVGITTETSVEGVKTLGNESATCYVITAKGEIATSSEMPITLLNEEKVDNDQKATPTQRRNTSVDQYEQIELMVTEDVPDEPGKRIELVVAKKVVDEPGKSASTILEVDTACQGRGLLLGLLFLVATTKYMSTSWYSCATIKP